MITRNHLLLPAALAALLAAGCANNNGEDGRDYGGTTPPATAEGGNQGLEGWEPSEDEIDLMSQEEYEQQYSKSIDEKNVDEEFDKLQKELGGG